uniref:Transcriptional regulator n=1 Tax=Ascaris lumbricoides TaxID=6252 RepID=A0A0M3HJY6_ASCLU
MLLSHSFLSYNQRLIKNVIVSFSHQEVCAHMNRQKTN